MQHQTIINGPGANMNDLFYYLKGATTVYMSSTGTQAQQFISVNTHSSAAASDRGGVSPRGLPDSSRVSGSGGSAGLQLSEAMEAKSRPKRCTCYSYKDKECVYYCHLDIIWINTPERTVPYGMSSYRGPQRIRRAVGEQGTEQEEAKTPRCICAVLDTDTECLDFCLSRSV
uniref:Endothelin-3 n=1 Tax=Dicentrarchus labrax TaxID=13489 RepID=A0A8C4IN74_DICLA